ncbi:hypothetical protein MKW98_021487 [Papaver atlanticum]|uniref:Uncharacterized protein n=1 Tax=Papaver atlanticum TaxID=357466 RepID=A0AAD4SRI0_9MAGN|nr:hypothetical protein MKW98_021487 [Papaver atlanticum]
MRQGSEKNGKSGKLTEGKRDRKSGSGYTWSGNGGIADDYTRELVLDEKDPNFVHPQDN